MRHAKLWWLVLGLGACDTPGGEQGVADAAPAAEDVAATSPPVGGVPDGEPVVGVPDGEPAPADPPRVVPEALVPLAASLPGQPSAPALMVAGAHEGEALAVWLQRRDESPWYALFSSRHGRDGWQAPEAVSPWQESMPNELALAMNAGGDALAVWLAGGVVASRWTPGVGWSEPALLGEAPAGGYLFEPKAALDDEGDALVAWGAGEWGGAVTLRSLLGKGGEWQAAFELTSAAGSMGQAAYDVALAGGTLLATWSERDGDDVRLLARRGSKAAGAPAAPLWHDVEEVARSAGWVSQLWAELDERGAAFAGWATHEELADGSSAGRVSGARAATGAAFARAQLIADGLPASFGFGDNAPRLAANARGEMLLLWRHFAGPLDYANPTPSSLRAKAYTPEDGWGEAEDVADGLAGPYLGCAMPPAEGFEVVLGDAGQALVVWEERGDDGTLVADVWARARSAGGAWGDIVTLGTGEGRWARAPSAALGGGAGYVLWTEEGADALSGAWTSRLLARRLALE